MLDEINPDSLMLRQSDGMWQRYCALLLWKLRGEKAVNINEADIREMTDTFTERGGVTVKVHGHINSITFQLIDAMQAHRLAIDEARKGGHA